MFNKKNRYLYNPIYDQSSLSSFVGLMTFKYFLLFCKNIELLHSTKYVDFQSLEEFERKNGYIDYFIRCENLESDFFDVIEKNHITLVQKQRDHILTMAKTNTTKRKRSLEYYYDDKLIEMVKDKEQYIIDKFGYNVPIVS